MNLCVYSPKLTQTFPNIMYVILPERVYDKEGIDFGSLRRKTVHLDLLAEFPPRESPKKSFLWMCHLKSWALVFVLVSVLIMTHQDESLEQLAKKCYFVFLTIFHILFLHSNDTRQNGYSINIPILNMLVKIQKEKPSQAFLS